jgi:hypothetical protein
MDNHGLHIRLQGRENHPDESEQKKTATHGQHP